MIQAGVLYVVGTPIGNLQDITLRAIDTLKAVDVIAAEDTRRTKKLLNHFHIVTSIVSYHDHNKERVTSHIIDLLKSGKNMALVADAGTPCISDPGYFLLNAVVKESIEVIPIPGPSALTAILSICALPTDRIVFEGYLSRKRGKKEKKLNELKSEKRTMIFFESPHRILFTLEDILNSMGNRRIVIGRELTKLHEEILRGSVEEVLHTLKLRTAIKGEFVLVLQGSD